MSTRNIVIAAVLGVGAVVIVALALRPGQQPATADQNAATSATAEPSDATSESDSQASAEATPADQSQVSAQLPTATPDGAESPLALGQSSPLGSPLASPLLPGGLTPERPALPVATYRVVNEFPHDPNAFTQGLVFLDGTLFESTGLRGHSTLRQVDLATGDVLRSVALDDDLWGEGMTILGDKVYQITYKAGIGFVYDKDTFEAERAFSYPTDGWGLTTDGAHLIRSDGSSSLYFLDPVTFEEIRRVEVFDENGPVARLNELEFINGEIWANIFTTDRIARIAPESGQVTGWIDLTGLLPEEKRTQPVDVLNGIAYDVETNRLFVTGKLWPALYEIELVDANQ